MANEQNLLNQIQTEVDSQSSTDSMTANQVQTAICNAIDIIVSEAISEIEYDKTVQATIIECLDESLGYYKLKYQDAIIYAYSQDLDHTYLAGATVYVLIPSNDTSKNKIILGTVDNLGLEYATVVEGDEGYDINGTNIITSSETFGLRSYYPNGECITLYDKDNTNNLIQLDATAAEIYIKESEVIICGGVFKTNLPVEQQHDGNYGINFYLDFLNADGETITKLYTVDINTMIGFPYGYTTPVRQYGIFPVDAENFIAIHRIDIFDKDFPNFSENEEDWIEDIWISDFELNGAIALTDEQLNGYCLTFLTVKGTFFTSQHFNDDTLTIEPILKVHGNTVNISQQRLPVYWFSEDARVTSQNNEYYCNYGGYGWKCLNDYTIISSEDNSKEWVANQINGEDAITLTIKKSDIRAKALQYKCVILYDNQSVIIDNTITIQNLDAEFEVAIDSDEGTQFYLGIGTPTLTCHVIKTSTSVEEDFSDYTFAWAAEDSSGSYASITEGGNQYGTLKDNQILEIPVSNIYLFCTYICSVYDTQTDEFIGTASITLQNGSEDEESYSLLITNGTYLFKYNEAGISPTSSSLLSPLVLTPLSFKLYDSLGNDITDDSLNSRGEIIWAVPANNTLLSISDDWNVYLDTENENLDWLLYKDVDSLPYEIASRYNFSKTNNDIYLIVSYNGVKLYAKTNLTFVKEGENGTNGTEYSCKIVPNISNTTILPQYLVCYESSSGAKSYNYNFSSFPFNLQIYQNENLIATLTNGSSSATVSNNSSSLSINVVWSVLQNNYGYVHGSALTDQTSLSINKSSSSSSYSFSFNEFQNCTNGTSVIDYENCPANIVKAVISIRNSKTYETTSISVTAPVITVKYSTSNNIEINYKESSGFTKAIYTSDGHSPSYDNTSPFEIIIDGNVNVSEYQWYLVGSAYRNDWTSNEIFLEEDTYTAKKNGQEDNQLWVVPADSYDGLSVTNAIVCRIMSGGNEMGVIHIPIHLMLNQYGLSSLNGWDGNSIEINEDGENSFILAPQIGAGIKNTNNTFTGVVMGKIQEANSSSAEVGLFGFSEGKRSFFLDANTGKSIFGTADGGQIIIDPTDNQAIIQSGNYVVGESGLKIDFAEPSIAFGSGNFTVDSGGNVVIQGTAKIAGETVIGDENGGRLTVGNWHVDEDSIYIGSKNTTYASGGSVIVPNFNNLSGDAQLSTLLFARRIFNDGYDPTSKNEYHSSDEYEIPTNLCFAIGAHFGVAADGTIYASNARISGRLDVNIGSTVGGWEIGDYTIYSITTDSDSTYMELNSSSEVDYGLIVGGNDPSSAPFVLYKDGSLDVLDLNLYGYIKVYIDKTNSSLSPYGQIGYMQGYTDSGTTDGIGCGAVNDKGDVTKYLIATNSGVRIQCEDCNLWLGLDSINFENATVKISDTASLETDGPVYIKNSLYFNTYGSHIYMSSGHYIYLTGTSGDDAVGMARSGDQLLVGDTAYPFYLRGSYFETVVSGNSGIHLNANTGPVYINAATDIYLSSDPVITSDLQLKHNISYLTEDYLYLIDKISPIKFIYDNDLLERYTFGYSAQDIKKLLNQEQEQYSMLVQNDEGILSLSYNQFVPLLHLKIKQQEQEIRQLAARISVLEKQGNNY